MVDGLQDITILSDNIGSDLESATDNLEEPNEAVAVTLTGAIALPTVPMVNVCKR